MMTDASTNSLVLVSDTAKPPIRIFLSYNRDEFSRLHELGHKIFLNIVKSLENANYSLPYPSKALKRSLTSGREKNFGDYQFADGTRLEWLKNIIQNFNFANQYVSAARGLNNSFDVDTIYLEKMTKQREKTNLRFTAQYTRQIEADKEHTINVSGHKLGIKEAFGDFLSKIKTALSNKNSVVYTTRQTVNVELGTELEAVLVYDGIERNRVKGIWDGKNLQFPLTFTPTRDDLGKSAGYISIEALGIPILQERIEYKPEIVVPQEEIRLSNIFAAAKREGEKLVVASVRAVESFFISYAHSDMKKAEKIRMHLEAVGITVLMDKYFKAGVNWMLQAAQMIDSAEKFLVLWSKSAADSKYVEQEIVYALDYAEPSPEVRHLLLDNTPPHPRLKHIHACRYAG